MLQYCRAYTDSGKRFAAKARNLDWNNQNFAFETGLNVRKIGLAKLVHQFVARR